MDRTVKKNAVHSVLTAKCVIEQMVRVSKDVKMVGMVLAVIKVQIYKPLY